MPVRGWDLFDNAYNEGGEKWHLRSQRPTCQKISEQRLISSLLWQINHNDLVAEKSFILVDWSLQLHCMFKSSVNLLTLQHSITLSNRDYEWMIAALQQCTSYEAPVRQPPFSLFALLHTTLAIQWAQRMWANALISNSTLYIEQVFMQKYEVYMNALYGLVRNNVHLFSRVLGYFDPTQVSVTYRFSATVLSYSFKIYSVIVIRYSVNVIVYMMVTVTHTETGQMKTCCLIHAAFSGHSADILCILLYKPGLFFNHQTGMHVPGHLQVIGIY